METDKVIVVQLDCLMGKNRMTAFRKSLIDQMKDGLVIIPPWAHVAYVGDECTVEIKEEKSEPAKGDKIARQILADMAGMSVNDDINAISKRLIFGASSNPLPKPHEKRKIGKWTHGRELWREHIGDVITAICYENWRCSECGALVKDAATKVLWKYCPWCGAKMEEESE